MRRSLVGVAVLALLATAGSCAATPVTGNAAEKAKVPAGCSVQVVAHEDDDLLFMNPDVQRDVRAGGCVRTVYLTAGDAGMDEAYWRGRETGVKAAYATMAGVKNTWANTELAAGGRKVGASTLSSSGVTLVFLRLPDGFYGDGSPRYGQQSLQKLWEGTQERITPADKSAAYTRAELIAVVRALLDGATRVRIQDFRGNTGPVGAPADDHHDHRAAAYFGYAAFRQLPVRPPLTSYRAYSTSEFPVNVEGADLELKKKAFYAYTAFDELVGCKDDKTCAADPTMGGQPSPYQPWISRQHHLPGAAPDGSTEIRAVNTRCLDVRDFGTHNGAIVQLWDCANSINQSWSLTAADEIRGHGGKCLDADPAGAVRLWDCTGAASQKWALDGSGELRTADRCLATVDPGQPNGTPATAAKCTGETRQKWRLV
jgi:LmbE family N-acetylglucosaminyl deacetylase